MYHWLFIIYIFYYNHKNYIGSQLLLNRGEVAALALTFYDHTIRVEQFDDALNIFFTRIDASEPQSIG